MTHPIEDRLREAYQAKTAQLTEQRLDQLAEHRERAMDDLLDDAHTGDLPILGFDEVPTSPRLRWVAPGLAAAAVVALAVGATAVVANHLDSRLLPNPPATRVTSPTPSSSQSVSPSPSASASARASSTAIAGPGYLPRGQTGSRGEVPWSAVGSGWRLVLPSAGAGKAPASLYLYDPIGGRYLISDRLPAGADLLAWSPDGGRAMLRSGSSDAPRYQEVSLHSATLSDGFTAPSSSFVSYTRPNGLSVLLQQSVDGTARLVRYDTAGHLKLRYPADLSGVGALSPGSTLYLPDGGQLITAALKLVTNDGHLVRSYPLPSGYDSCTPLKWWTADTVLEVCLTPPGPGEPAAALYLQPVAGGTPSVLTDAAGQTDGGYGDAWPLSNGHVLLGNHVSCGISGYDILVPGKAPRPLRGPAGVGAAGFIISMAGDLATFAVGYGSSCGGIREASALVDYDMVTGQTHQLLDRLATIVAWPAEPS